MADDIFKSRLVGSVIVKCELFVTLIYEFLPAQKIV